MIELKDQRKPPFAKRILTRFFWRVFWASVRHRVLFACVRHPSRFDDGPPRCSGGKVLVRRFQGRGGLHFLVDFDTAYVHVPRTLKETRVPAPTSFDETTKDWYFWAGAEDVPPMPRI